MIEDAQLSGEIAKKLCLDPEINVKIWFEQVKSEGDSDDLLHIIFGNYFRAFDRIGRQLLIEFNVNVNQICNIMLF
jgi:hypothetical protein